MHASIGVAALNETQNRDLFRDEENFTVFIANGQIQRVCKQDIIRLDDVPHQVLEPSQTVHLNILPPIEKPYHDKKSKTLAEVKENWIGLIKN